MCGIPCPNANENELLLTPPNNLNMPPSVTLGAEPPKMSIVPEQPFRHESQPSGVPLTREISDGDESDAMQKAIALSLQEQLPPSSYYADDSESTELSPYDNKRRNSTYVGLKNIGNSCWFNVVIQPLFHIPAFREIIFNYATDVSLESYSKFKYSDKSLIHIFRLLCANLLASERKFVDPTECVNLFQNEEMMKNTQQDVCEFIHKLLQKLEEEYKLLRKQKGVEKENADCKIPNEAEFHNPILHLFYGESKKEDYKGPKKEPFGQYPLSVQNYGNIHESILASMTTSSMQESDIILPVLQENWFKQLPPVLIFSLSRYEFSKEKQRAEKVHNKFDFPDSLYLDRYMETNKDIIKEKHIKVAEIKNELIWLYKTLEQYQKFGSENGKYPIIDILKYTLEFAKCKSHVLTEPMDVDSAATSDFEMLEGNKSQNMEVEIKARECDIVPKAKCSSIESRFKFIGYPAPESLIDGELDILQTCLPRWQTEMEQKVYLLQKEINNLENQLNEIYNEPSLQCILYKLHAVIVHEGQASGGHYWVYIYDNKKSVWLKFNDIQVTESSWEEVLQDSVGGQNNASAYCLMYIDKTRYEEIFLCDKSECQPIMENLPLDLQEYVKAENMNFLKEQRDFELKRSQEAAREKENKLVPATAPNSPEASFLNEDEAKFYLSIKTMMTELLENYLNKFDETKVTNITDWVRNSIHSCKIRINELAISKRDNDNFSEPAIMDFSIYLQQNSQSDAYISLYGEEILWQLVQINDGPSMNMLEIQIKTCLKKLMELNIEKRYWLSYNEWKKHYHMYIKCAWYFNCGHKSYMGKHFEIALSYFLHCLNLHKQLENPPIGPHKTLNINLLFHFHRICFKHVNDNLIESFMNASNEAELLEVDENISKFILPALFFSINSPCEENVNITDFVRGRWIELLDKLDPLKNKMFQPIITKLFSNAEHEVKHDSDVVAHYEGEVVSLPLLKVPPYPHVLSIFEEYKNIANAIISVEKNQSQTSDL